MTNLDSCIVLFWTRKGPLKGILAMGMLSTMVFILGIFLNILMVIPIIFNGKNRQKHVHYISIGCSNVLFITVSMPLLMQVYGSSNYILGDECNGWLPFVVIFFSCKTTFDMFQFALDTYLNIRLHHTNQVRTSNILSQVIGLGVTWVVSLILACCFVWIDAERVLVSMLAVFIFSVLCTAIMLYQANRIQAATNSSTNEEESWNENTERESLKRKYLVVAICFILIGQFIICSYVWTGKSEYLNENMLFSMVICAYAVIVCPIFVTWEHRIIQKFYYKNCINHRTVYPM